MLPFQYLTRVYYDDTDAGGIVYYANYLRFAERARTEWLRSVALQSSDLRRDHQILIVVKTAALDYHTPAHLDDALAVGVAVKAVGASSMTLEQIVTRGQETVCTMQIVLVCISSETGRPVRWPEVVRAKLGLA